MIRILSVKNKYGSVVKIPLYPDPFETLFTKQDGTPLVESNPIEDIELSVEDVCRIAKALKHEMAIDNFLEPTPERQRIHQILTS